jgi:hypothetical protein
MAGYVKTIQTNLGATKVAKPRGSFAKIPGAIKIRPFFFYPPIAGYSPEEENRQLEKLHSMLREISRASSSIGFSAFVFCPQAAHPQGMVVNR